MMVGLRVENIAGRDEPQGALRDYWEAMLKVGRELGFFSALLRIS